MSLRFTEEHEWVKAEGEDVIVGITSHAAEELGEVVYVDLCEEGEQIEKSAEFGSVESVKTVSGLFAPVSGTVSSVNQAVVDNPELINQSPMDQAWLIKIRPEDISELDELMSEEAYQTFLNQ